MRQDLTMLGSKLGFLTVFGLGNDSVKCLSWSRPHINGGHISAPKILVLGRHGGRDPWSSLASQ